MQIKEIAFAGVAALIVAWILDEVLQAYRHAANAKAKGCLAPILGKDSGDRSGVTVTLKGLKAIRNKTYPDWMLARLDRTAEKYGHTVATIQVSQPFFRRTIYTIEPQNLQAVLATQFKDFGLGIGRTDNFAPLLGNGIVRRIWHVLDMSIADEGSLPQMENNGNIPGRCCDLSLQELKLAISKLTRSMCRL